MRDKRLHLRVAIPADVSDDFRDAKGKAESVAGVVMSDGQFAVSLIKWAIATGHARND